MNAVSIKLPDNLNNALEWHATQQGLRKSQLMRTVLENLVPGLIWFFCELLVMQLGTLYAVCITVAYLRAVFNV